MGVHTFWHSIVVVGVGGALAAQTPSNLPAEPIGNNDLLSIVVYDAPELSGPVRVSPEGKIVLPLLARPITARGMLPADLQIAIAKALKDGELLKRPVVTVQVLEYQSRPVVVSGAVKRPVTFQAVGAMTLLDAITRAEGLTPEAGAEILVSTPDAETVRRVPVSALLGTTDPQYAIPLHGGELIRVPERGKIYVVGNVRRPGTFPADEASVLKMLSLTEGLAPYAAKTAFIYRQTDESRERSEVPVDLRRILSREAPDIPLAANDILYVPQTGNKRLGLAALEKVLVFGSTAGATAIIYRGIR
jgi:polysaccharide export outer membrane protein